ncbi:hypothetical protein HMPREF1568_3853 [Providencia alcalifaciens PAL-3]|nr:hypothetical protein HMPREF1568_3853 [Providencia alcalifaciens PAL-3]EUC99213.1 hypothetical protein HMPREF1566_3830 [Providencia alcalifaciens PAL-1]UNJ79519.1 hypothetical protein [Providencia sp.]
MNDIHDDVAQNKPRIKSHSKGVIGIFPALSVSILSLRNFLF